jgi:putative heme-binding domain-containing protein
VTHATPGSEFGWRSGTGKWPAYYADSLPQMIDIGPGSPVGVCFGYGTRFPAKYQRALFICDWTFGTMFAIHITPNGSTYSAVKEEFLSRTPLPLTDCAVGTDGALYFSVGGRGTQSELFRVTYVGDESTEPADLRDPDPDGLRALRHQIEALQRPTENSREAVEFLYGYLGHSDRFIRFAARVALEHQPVELWEARILQAVDHRKLINGAIALARQGSPEVQPKLISALSRINAAALEPRDFLDWLRAWQLVFIRLGELDEVTRTELADYFAPMFPVYPFDAPAEGQAEEWGYGISDPTEAANRELASILISLQSDQIAELALPFLNQDSRDTSIASEQLLARNQGYGGAVTGMHTNHPDLNQVHFAFILRNLKAPWTLEQRYEYFRWFTRAREWSGGASFQGFLKNTENDAWESCSDAERLAIELAGARTPYTIPELPKPVGPGQDWTIDAVLAEAATGLMGGRDFENGEQMYQAARCVVCHRFGGDGGATGPDLTQLAGRFNLKDLTEAILDPSKVISDQYRATMIATSDGIQHVGRVVGEDDQLLRLLTDPESSTKIVEVAIADIDERQPSPVSIMPKDLLKPLNRDEVLDLLAYLLSRGNPDDPMFD